MQPTAGDVRRAVTETRHKFVKPYSVTDGVKMAELPARSPEMTEAERWEDLCESINSQLSEFYYEILGNGFGAGDVLAEIKKWLRERELEAVA